MSKKRVDIEVLIIVDSREVDLSYVKPLVESEPTKDGIEFVGYRIEAVKPKGCKYSTGDLTILYRKKGTEEWLETNLAIELKKGLDMFSSIYTKKNRDNLYLEIDRASAYGLDFYFLITDHVADISKKVNNLPLLKGKHAESVYFKELLKLNKKLTQEGFDAVITTGDDLAFCIKRIIKKHIADKKLNYF